MTPKDKKPEDTSPGSDEAIEVSQEAQPVETEPSLEEKLAAAEADRLRALAELDNLHKRSQKAQEDARKYSNTDLLREMLTVVDNLERALESVSDTEAAEGLLKTIREGVSLVHKDLMALLERRGVKRFEALEKPFDPHHHQAMQEVDHDTIPPGHVAAVFQQGYTIHDRLLRPAMVTLVKKGT